MAPSGSFLARRMDADLKTGAAVRQKPAMDTRSIRTQLESDLAGAEASLKAAVAAHAKPGTAIDPVTEAALERVRAHCRQLRSTLNRLNIQEGRPKGYCVAEEPRPAPAAAAPQPSPRTKPASRPPVPAKRRAGARAMAWQGVEATSLVLAYLVYYYSDVYLQIASLPSAHVVAQGGKTLFG